MILGEQTQETCTNHKTAGQHFVNSNDNDPMILIAVKKHGLKLPNLTAYTFLINMIIEENCQMDANTRWIFIALSFPSIVLLPLSMVTCFIIPCIDL